MAATTAAVRGSRDGGAVKDRRARQPWLAERSLEVSVDARRAPVVVRLHGTLDAGTGANVEPVIRELLGEGHRWFLVDLEGLDVDAKDQGPATVDALQRTLAGAGARVAWTPPASTVGAPRDAGASGPVAHGRHGSAR